MFGYGTNSLPRSPIPNDRTTRARCSAFVAASLDGFIARNDGDLDWLDEANTAVPEDEDCGYREFIATVDAIIMGRKTFEKVLTFGEWPYGDLPVIVLTQRIMAESHTFPPSVSVSNESPEQVLQRLSALGHQHIYVDGGTTIGSFLALEAIDSVTVTFVPVLLGNGIPLFGPLPNDIRLKLDRSKTFDFGFVQLTYQVEKAP
jgi:dihydrofolate reductase